MTSPKFGQARAESGRNQTATSPPKPRQIWPNVGPELANIDDECWADFDRWWTEFGQLWPWIVRSWAGFGRMRAEVDHKWQIRLNSVEIVPGSTKFGPSSTNVGPISAKIGPQGRRSNDYLRELIEQHRVLERCTSIDSTQHWRLLDIPPEQFRAIFRARTDRPIAANVCQLSAAGRYRPKSAQHVTELVRIRGERSAAGRVEYVSLASRLEQLGRRGLAG